MVIATPGTEGDQGFLSFSVTDMRKFSTAMALFGVMALVLLGTTAQAATRTISFYVFNTGESLTVTYKRNGRFIPSAMRKINYILRDWRRNEIKRIDPKVVDLVWELHTQLGSRKSVRVISGYRSPKTNAMLRRRGRGVARFSRHMLGQAIDIYFPDVSLRALREAALIKQAGGVGYYPRSRQPFVHVDTGTVRHWPRMPAAQYAALLRNRNKYARYASRRKAGRKAVAVASRSAGRSARKPVRVASVRASRSRSTTPAPRRNPAYTRPADAGRLGRLVAATATPPLPRRKPFVVALAAPKGESWMLPSRSGARTAGTSRMKPSTMPVSAPDAAYETIAKPSRRPAPPVLASAEPVSPPEPATSTVKEKTREILNALVAFVLSSDTGPEQPATVPMPKKASFRLTASGEREEAKPAPAFAGMIRAAIASSNHSPVTTASISSARNTSSSNIPSRITPATKAVAEPAPVEMASLFDAAVPVQHVWKSEPDVLMGILRQAEYANPPVFAGMLFADAAPAGFAVEPAATSVAVATGRKTGRHVRRRTAAKEKPGLLRRLLSSTWGFLRPARADEKSETTVAIR